MCLGGILILWKHNINTQIRLLYTDVSRYCIFYTFMLTTTHSYYNTLCTYGDTCIQIVLLKFISKSYNVTIPYFYIIPIHTNIHLYTYIDIHIHTYLYIHIHTYIHTQTARIYRKIQILLRHFYSCNDVNNYNQNQLHCVEDMF